MHSMDIFNIDKLRDFIYDDSKKKVLIGSRGIGKTYSLALNMFKNAIKSKPRESTYIGSSTISLNYVKDIFIKIFNDFGMNKNVNIIELSKSHIKIIIYNKTIINLITVQKLSQDKYMRLKDVYIDEPNTIIAFNEIMDDILFRTLWTKEDCIVAIAGSSNIIPNNNLSHISADINFSRHCAKINDILSVRDINSMKDNIPANVFNTEFMCEFIKQNSNNK